MPINPFSNTPLIPSNPFTNTPSTPDTFENVAGSVKLLEAKLPRKAARNIGSARAQSLEGPSSSRKKSQPVSKKRKAATPPATSARKRPATSKSSSSPAPATTTLKLVKDKGANNTDQPRKPRTPWDMDPAEEEQRKQERLKMIALREEMMQKGRTVRPGKKSGYSEGLGSQSEDGDIEIVVPAKKRRSRRTRKD